MIIRGGDAVSGALIVAGVFRVPPSEPTLRGKNSSAPSDLAQFVAAVDAANPVVDRKTGGAGHLAMLIAIILFGGVTVASAGIGGAIAQAGTQVLVLFGLYNARVMVGQLVKSLPHFWRKDDTGYDVLDLPLASSLRRACAKEAIQAAINGVTKGLSKNNLAVF